MNLSPSKVNRLIAQGRKLGMVKIEIESPFQGLVDLERRLIEAGGLEPARSSRRLCPAARDTTLQQVGRAAANQLLETLRDGDIDRHHRRQGGERGRREPAARAQPST